MTNRNDKGQAPIIYIMLNSNPLPSFLAWSIGESPCAPQYSDIKQ